MAMTSVRSAGGDAVPGGYGYPTPHAAKEAEDPYVAPSSLPSGPTGTASTAAYDALDNGAGQATQL